MSEGMSDIQLLDIRGRHGTYVASHDHVGAFDCCSAHASADDVPALLDEVKRARGQLADLQAVHARCRDYYVGGPGPKNVREVIPQFEEGEWE